MLHIPPPIHDPVQSFHIVRSEIHAISDAAVAPILAEPGATLSNRDTALLQMVDRRQAEDWSRNPGVPGLQLQ